MPDGLLSIPTPCVPLVQLLPLGGVEVFVHCDIVRSLPPFVSEGTKTSQFESSLMSVVTMPLALPGTLGSEPSVV